MVKIMVYKNIRRLLRKGANPNFRDHEGDTPLYYFLSDIDGEEQRELEYEYESENYDWDPFHEYDYFDDPYYFDEDGFTPLHYQCQCNSWCIDRKNRKESLQTLKLLLKHGGDINLPNKEGCTPLIKGIHLCCIDNLVWPYIELLLEYSDLTESSTHKNRDVDILSRDYDSDMDDERYIPFSVWGRSIAHIAKLESIGVSVSSSLFNTMSEYEAYTLLFEMCRKELQELKNRKIAKVSWITCYDLLVDSRRKLKNYVANQAVNAFQALKWKIEFPIYGFIIEKKVLSAVARRKLWEESTSLLSKCWPIFNPMHLVIRDTLDCIMSKKSLSKFAKGESPNVNKRKRKQKTQEKQQKKFRMSDFVK